MTASSFLHRMACDNALQFRRNCTPTVHIEQFPTSLGLSTDTRRRRWNSVSDLFILMENEQKTTFTRAFEFTKQFLQSFNEQCVAHVDCQMAAIGAFKDVFGCRIRLCLFHQNQSVWKAVSRYKLAAAYNSMTNKRLHVWIRRLLSLPFLPERDIVENFLSSSNMKLSMVRSVSRTNSKMASGTSSRTTNDSGLSGSRLTCGASRAWGSGQTTDAKASTTASGTRLGLSIPIRS